MKILLAIILIFPIFNIVAQNPVQPKDSTVGKDELIIISPEKKVHSDTSELMIIRDSSQKHKEANISELFIIAVMPINGDISVKRPIPAIRRTLEWILLWFRQFR